ncbi:MAG: MCE-family protein Mce1B / MCE-family protein Mce1C [Ilumatobacteraceae bacterium]|nr:MCE-family protein Mce1B / MCE-family protein Mce1C [Ilumatobacteraceae bacterium]
MKAFTERNPITIGVIVIALIAAGTTAALALNGGAFKDRYIVNARFSDTAGLRSGDKVRVAGILAGQVGSIREHNGRVDVSLKIDESVELPGDVQAEVVVETLLGSKYVRLVGGGDWDHPLEAGDVITDTVTPTEVLDVENVGTPLLEDTDAEAINDLLGKIDRVTEGQRGNVGEIVDGLNRLTKAVNDRQAEARRLIGSSRVVTATLAERDEDLLAALDDVNVVLDGLAHRRVQLATLLRETEATARKTADLVGENRPQIDAILQEIHRDLAVVERNQTNLAESLSGLTNAIGGFASIGYSGADEVPNTWANMYTQLVGPLSPDALFGSCGLLDDAFDVLLGPDPVTDCAARTGPLPTATDSEDGSGDPLTDMYGSLAGGGS